MNIRTRWEAARATVFGVPKEKSKVEIKSTNKLVLGAVEQNYGIYQIPSFRDQVTTFWNDPLLKEAVTMFAEQVVATETYLTDNPEYTKEINGKKAIDVIKEWCDENNIDIKLVDICIELKAFGNSFWRLDEDMGFVKIPVEAVWHVVRINPKIPLQEKYHLQLMPIYGGIIIPYEEFIHFRIGVTGYHAPFGQGVIYGLLAKPVDSTGTVCPSIYDIRLGMRASLNEGFRKFSFGNELWCFAGMSNEDFSAKDEDGNTIGDKIANMSSTGNRIATNVEGKIQLAVPQRTESYDKFIQYMRDEFMMSLADPSLKLGLEQGFTKATSTTAKEVYRYKVTTMRNVIKQNLEDLFKQILDRLGYDGMEAGIKLNFGIEEVAEYNVADIFAAFDRQLISQEEARHILSKYQKWDIAGKGPTIAKIQTPSNETKPTGLGNMPKGAKIPLSSTQPNNRHKEIESSIVPQALNTVIEYIELPEGIAGYNADFSKIYIDTTVQPKALSMGLDYNKVEKLITAHEVFEYQALRAGKSWTEAHRLATMYEKTIARDIGVDWESYNGMYLSLLPIIKERKSPSPSDLIWQGKGVGE
jgi:hypothetical protein